MKKIVILLAVLFVFVGIGWAQETPVPPPEHPVTQGGYKAIPEPTLDELKWQDAFITERLKVMRYEFDKLQAQQKRIQAVIKAKSQPEEPKAK